MHNMAAASAMNIAKRIAASFTHAPTWVHEAMDGATVRQLLISFRPWNPVTVDARVTSVRRQGRSHAHSASTSVAIADPPSGLFVSGAVLTHNDRFNVAYAALAMARLQAGGFAGSTAIHLSTAGLMDPELPIYLVSQLQRHGVNPVGVSVTLAPQLRRPLPRSLVAR